MKHLFIINPAAGKTDRTGLYSAHIQEVCEKWGAEFEIAVSQGPGDICRIAKEAAQIGEELRIYACGGDGTLNEVVNGVAGYSNVAVTHYAGGSGNDFVRLFDKSDAFRDLDELMDCQEATFDLVRCNGAVALNTCSVGLDARIGTQMAAFKRLPLISGSLAYILSAAVNVVKGMSEHYVVQINGETVDAEQTMICACNGRFYGGGFNPVPDADPGDGMLDVLLVKKLSRLKVPSVIGKYKKGLYRCLPDLVRHFKTTEVTVLCDKPTPISLDGELRTATEIRISIAPEKLRFFYPRSVQLCAPECRVK